MLHFRMRRWATILIFLAAYMPGFSQETAKTDNCLDYLKKGNSANELGSYEDALLYFDSLLATCKTSTSLINGNAGKARAMNGLNRYPEAIAAAQSALEKAQNKSVIALFERADAYFAMNKTTEANADYDQLEKRSLKTTNTKEKAFILSKLSMLNLRQNKTSEAIRLVNKAISLDPANPSLFILQGDIKSKSGQLTEAFTYYDRALSNKAEPLLIHKKKADAFTFAMQQKYQVHDAKELRLKMGINEKQEFCELWKNAFSNGYTNKRDELAFSLICL
ncbi:tetratricopeptide repeat protein [Flavihumibacter profundi]|uniref:tetratricopeptide repeat protein n=1 Tax=Flavihumibacter profundi TaxID=2716883 RepID=UPI001CC48D26|nr:tetratricopeptide repeat protein [Flavihumibacter profundi]MBZ5858851.1 tetratricopeptide repeat protein [Flavihumibacter profundi]